MVCVRVHVILYDFTFPPIFYSRVLNFTIRQSAKGLVVCTVIVLTIVDNKKVQFCCLPNWLYDLNVIITVKFVWLLHLTHHTILVRTKYKNENMAANRRKLLLMNRKAVLVYAIRRILQHNIQTLVVTPIPKSALRCCCIFWVRAERIESGAVRLVEGVFGQ